MWRHWLGGFSFVCIQARFGCQNGKRKTAKKKIYIYIKIEKKKDSSVAGRMSVSSVTSFFLIYQVDPAL